MPNYYYNIQLIGNKIKAAEWLPLAKKKLAQLELVMGDKSNLWNNKKFLRMHDDTLIELGFLDGRKYIKITSGEKESLICPLYNNGMIRSSRIVSSTDTAGINPDLSDGNLSTVYLKEGSDWITKFALGKTPYDKFPNITNPELSQHATVKSTMYSGYMRLITQKILGRVIRLKFRYDWYETDGILLDNHTVNYLWDQENRETINNVRMYLVKICKFGVFIKNLDWCDDGQENITTSNFQYTISNRTLQNPFFFPFNSRETGFFIDFEDPLYESKLASKGIIQLLNPIERSSLEYNIDNYSPFFDECGWSFPYMANQKIGTVSTGYYTYDIFNTRHENFAISYLDRLSIFIPNNNPLDNSLITATYLPDLKSGRMDTLTTSFLIPNYIGKQMLNFPVESDTSTYPDPDPGTVTPIYAFYAFNLLDEGEGYYFPDVTNDRNQISIICNVSLTIVDNYITQDRDFLIQFTGDLPTANCILFKSGRDATLTYLIPFSVKVTTATVSGVLQRNISIGHTVGGPESQEMEASCRGIAIPLYDRECAIASYSISLYIQYNPETNTEIAMNLIGFNPVTNPAPGGRLGSENLALYSIITFSPDLTDEISILNSDMLNFYKISRSFNLESYPPYIMNRLKDSFSKKEIFDLDSNRYIGFTGYDTLDLDNFSWIGIP